jgi:NADH-quinone oxidoreductase subunit J
VVGLDEANEGGNVPAIANILFSKYVFAFEATSALLITAAVGAMVLAHRERLTPKATQADLAAQRIRDFGTHGKHPGPLPSPGVYARHNAVDTPALLPDGTAAESSVSRVLAARGTVRSAPALADDIDDVRRQLAGLDGHSDPTEMPETSGKGGTPASTEEDVKTSPGSSSAPPLRSSTEQLPGGPK